MQLRGRGRRNAGGAGGEGAVAGGGQAPCERGTKRGTDGRAGGRDAGSPAHGEERDPRRLAPHFHAWQAARPLGQTRQHRPATLQKAQFQRALHVQGKATALPHDGRRRVSPIRPAARAKSRAGECKRGEEYGERGAERVLHQPRGKGSMGRSADPYAGAGLKFRTADAILRDSVSLRTPGWREDTHPTRTTPPRNWGAKSGRSCSFGRRTLMNVGQASR